ncbi:MAG: hypothetical protein DA408_09700 [Bacteroidetes bacterium]|nr:MAG: hypothetical protein C7N36_10670 [Bacteroidota bacterium]PTM12673.1 MAG: hypothetical protein DA408_09700 [Bacteroidota bacterium]
MRQSFLWTALPTALQPAIKNAENGVVSLYSYATILRMLALDNPAFMETLEREGVALEEPLTHDQLLSVNSCWLQRGEVTPTPATLAGLQALGVTPTEVDFHTGTDAARTINAATAEGTQGQILELLPEHELADKLRHAIALYLNTLLYMGKWGTAFDPLNTYAGSFAAPQGPVTTNFMVATELFDVVAGYDDLCVATVGNCMQDGQTLFCALMPRADVPMAQLLERLSRQGIPGWQKGHFELHLPKFALAEETDLSALFPALVPAAMPGLGWARTPVDILQKASLRIDEKGVEAAAATAAVVSRGVTQQVVFNRPFLVLILNAQDQPIFAAVVNDPTPEGPL